jgi:MFS family permease
MAHYRDCGVEFHWDVYSPAASALYSGQVSSRRAGGCRDERAHVGICCLYIFFRPGFGRIKRQVWAENHFAYQPVGLGGGLCFVWDRGALWILFLGRIIDGLTAGNISTLFAYVSDSTEPKERAKWFGYIGSAMGIGKLGGPL